MQQEFEPKLPRDILKMSRNKSFNIKARFGAIYSASKTKKYLLKNSTIGNRQEENFTVYFSGKKAIIITSKHGTTIFFSL